MKKYLSAVMALLLLGISSGSSASSRARKNQENRMMSIDLVGMKILNSHREDTFGYAIKVKEDIEDVENLVAEEAGEDFEVSSRIFELAGPSSFKNVLVFVAKSRLARPSKSPQYKLFVIYVNRSGSTFAVDFDITKISNTQLEAVSGPRDELEVYTISTGRNLFGRGGPLR